MSGIKFDSEKPDLSLLPKDAKEGIARAFMYGEKKYGRYNFMGGMEWSRLLAAADRHLTAFNAGEDNDSESGLNHLYHAGACIMMLITYQALSLGTDNRFKQPSKKFLAVLDNLVDDIAKRQIEMGKSKLIIKKRAKK